MRYLMRKYSVSHPLLKKFVKFFWEVKSDNVKLNHKIIPLRNIDLRFNLSDTPGFIRNGDCETKLEDIFFTGLHEQNKNSCMVSNGEINMLGICFYPEGFYPFVKTPSKEFKNQFVSAGDIGLGNSGTVLNKLREAEEGNLKIKILEEYLLSLYSEKDEVPDELLALCCLLRNSEHPVKVDYICTKFEIPPRRLERLFSKYVGLPPKTYINLNRFQNGLHQLLSKNYNRFTDVVYSNGYFDQMHFIKEFKRFAGTSPGCFVEEGNTMMHLGKLS